MRRIACVGDVAAMEWECLYDKAMQIATRVHAGQHDKVGKDYILHPLRVADRCVSSKAKIVALLHDTIEDTDVTEEYLRQQGFPDDIVDAVMSVTRREGEDYEAFIRRAAANPIGRQVKIADLEDNMDIRRLPDISDHDVVRLRKYLQAWYYLHQKNELIR